MTTGKAAKARTQWVARAMEEERRSLERRRKILGDVYDEVDRYMEALNRIRPMLRELSSQFGIGRADVKRLFGMSDREVSALYEPKNVAIPPPVVSLPAAPATGEQASAAPAIPMPVPQGIPDPPSAPDPYAPVQG